MIIKTENINVGLVEKNDVVDILGVYNSNIKFLQAHMGNKSVDNKWLEEEIESMKKAGFYSCKVVDKKAEKIIGLLDFSLKEEAYLSLLMIHDSYKNKGYGKEIYFEFERYIRSSGCKAIRIDVVTSYDKNVLEFWKHNGFKVIDNIELNWTGKMLPAAVMKKYL